MLVSLALGCRIEVSHEEHNVLWRLDLVIYPVDGSLNLMQPNLIVRDRVVQMRVAHMESSAVLEDELQPLNVPIGAQVEGVTLDEAAEALLELGINQYGIAI